MNVSKKSQDTYSKIYQEYLTANLKTKIFQTKCIFIVAKNICFVLFQKQSVFINDSGGQPGRSFWFWWMGSWGDGRQMTAEDQLIPSTLPLILSWNIYSRFNCNIYSRFKCNTYSRFNFNVYSRKKHIMLAKDQLIPSTLPLILRRNYSKFSR